MSGRIEARLAELSIALPSAPPPAGAYVPFVVADNLVFVSGQLPMLGGELRYRGRIGHDLSVDDGYAAARLCGLNLLAQAHAALNGDLDRVSRVVKLGGFVQCAETFADHPKVINGASDLMADVFGDKGRHTRFAVGSASLPLAAAVEVEAVFQFGP